MTGMAQLDDLEYKATERCGVRFQITSSNLGKREITHCIQTDRKAQKECRALDGFPQVAGRFSIAQLPTQSSVFPNPSSLWSEFPHSFGYFKLVLRSL